MTKKTTEKDLNPDISNVFIDDIRNIILDSRQQAIRSVDFARVMMYWRVGERIFVEEQQGKERTEYGAFLIKGLSKQILPEFGSGFSERILYQALQFYKTYPKVNGIRSQLNWTQYRDLFKYPTQINGNFLN